MNIDFASKLVKVHPHLGLAFARQIAKLGGNQRAGVNEIHFMSAILKVFVLSDVWNAFGYSKNAIFRSKPCASAGLQTFVLILTLPQHQLLAMPGSSCSCKIQALGGR